MISRPMVIAAVMVALLCSSGAAPVLAHHSYSAFDRRTKVTLEGDITDVTWSNPHVMLTVMPPDGRPMRIEWRTVRQLAKTGVGPEILKIGDHVIIVGSPHKNRNKRIMTLLETVSRPADGWTWSRHSKRKQP